MKKLLTSLILVFTCVFVFSQNDQRIAKSKTPLSDIEKVVMPMQDNDALLAAEIERRKPGLAPKFAVNLETSISPSTHGNWETLASGHALWRLRIISKNAKSLNLGFTKYNMPRGGTLILYSPDKERVMGPFTPADNEAHEQLWTPVLDGDELVIEVQVPKKQKHLLELELKYVNHDFIGFTQMASGSCNLDVICGAADGWEIVDAYRDIIQSVAAISEGGDIFCTGFLVNNVRQDCTPYFMTANHCGFNSGSDASLVAYWNFNNSTCREPNTFPSGTNGDGLLSDFNTGSIWRAGWFNSDFTLLELDDPVSATANAFYAGWSAEDIATADTTITIHHPNGEEKRISFEFDDTYIANYSGGPAPPPNPNGSYIIIPDWDIGTTEGGSSGAPLFNKQKRVVGQLFGGAADCNTDEFDVYGRIARSWIGGGTPTTGLKNWLDPDDTGIIAMDGRSGMLCNLFVNATPNAVEICTPAEALYTISVSPGFQTSVSLSINNLPAGLTATFDTNPIMPGGSTTLTIDNTNALPSGDYTFIVTGTDGLESNFSELSLTISNGVPAVLGISPLDGEVNVPLSPIFVWEDIFSTEFTIEIATDHSFNNVVFSANGIDESEFQLNMDLLQSHGYFWRVKGMNVCGEGDWSEVYLFSTRALVCSSNAPLDVPIVISSSGATTITSVIEITTAGVIDDVNVSNIDISHSWVSDLNFELTSPGGKTIQLMNNVFGGECEGHNIFVSFDDEASNPYSVLDGMCNTTPPALTGIFQPSMALSAFVDEEAKGNWTLTVYDDVDQDGGTLHNWALDICIIDTTDLSIISFADEVENCPGGTSSFILTLGSGFNAVNGASLSASNLPTGATATFDPNPAMPGEQVNVTLSGATLLGVFNVEILADDGTGIGSTEIEWIVEEDLPDAPTAVSPLQNATGVPLNTPISWSDIAGVDYQFQVATDPDFTNVISEGNTPTNSSILDDLEYCTTYYWQVIASNDCGDSDVAEVYSFTTEKDLSFAASQANFTICNFGTVNVPLSVGACFEASGVNLSNGGLPTGATVSFSANPVFSNENVDVEIALNNVDPGIYMISINGDDGVNSVSETLTLEVEGAAGQADLIDPSNMATDVNVEPSLVWDAVAGATSYKFELALDDDFNDIVYEITQQQATVALPIMLEHLTTYYWRITAFNNCGGTTSAPFSFTTEKANAVVDINGLQLEILPNPTHGVFFIKSSVPLNEQIAVKVFSINGILLLEKIMGEGTVSTSLDLMGYPSGVYVVRLASGNAVAIERVVVE